MRNFRKILAFGVILSSLSLFGATSSLKVREVAIDINEKARILDVSLDLSMKDFKVPGSGEVVFTPVILSENGNDSVVMQPFTVCGRSRYYYYMREGVLDSGTSRVYRAGSKEQVKIHEKIKLQPWMLDNATVEVRQQGATCCSAPVSIPGDSKWGNVLVARLNSPAPELKFDYVFSPPMEDEPVKKSYEGKAFVTFVVNRTELNPTYMDNPAELKKITNTIDVVKNDPDAIITEIHIRGYASPEGPYDNNVRLAQGRTQTLSKYVNSLYHFAPEIMTTSYDPEDWEGLRSYVKDSLQFDLKNREGLLEIINGTLPYDARDAALKKQYPADYQIILKDIYPWLRHSDYSVRYQVKVYSDLQNLNRLYREDPTKLRPVDFYTIAGQYKTGSKQYQEVMKTAVRVYPDHPMINLNAANIYLMENNPEAAQSCLLKAGNSPQANYARGILAAKREDYKEAVKWFNLASEGGIKQASQYIRQIEKAENTNPVDILIKTENN